MRYCLLALACAFACTLQATAIPFPEPPRPEVLAPGLHKPHPAVVQKPHPAAVQKPHPAAAQKPHPAAVQKPHPAAVQKPLPAEPKPVQSTDVGAFFEGCPQGPEWIRYNDSCYRYFETYQYWYLAELQCRKRGGHLVSIGNRKENLFVAKLTYCESAWTGRYSVHVDKLRDPSNYRWTDGSNSGLYHEHNFTSISSIHEPLISVANLKWNNNVYHAKDKYVCEVKSTGGGNNCGCPDGWKYLNGSCYLISKSPATYLEGTFFCSGFDDAHMVSVHSEQELRALSLLDVEGDGCPPEVWIGLIKINPCRTDFRTGKPICYRWADRSKDYYDGFPAWHPGHPDMGLAVNCVYLQDKAMKSVLCYERHRFVCKKPADRSSY